MTELTESDLAQAKAAVGAIFESLELTAHLYAVEAREGVWAVIVECATESGWQRAELHAGPELLAAGRGDPEAKAALLAQWQPHLVACKKD
jgi:hypothetical protein